MSNGWLVWLPVLVLGLALGVLLFFAALGFGHAWLLARRARAAAQFRRRTAEFYLGPEGEP